MTNCNPQRKIPLLAFLAKLTSVSLLKF